MSIVRKVLVIVFLGIAVSQTVMASLDEIDYVTYLGQNKHGFDVFQVNRPAWFLSETKTVICDKNSVLIGSNRLELGGDLHFKEGDSIVVPDGVVLELQNIVLVGIKQNSIVLEGSSSVLCLNNSSILLNGNVALRCGFLLEIGENNFFGGFKFCYRFGMRCLGDQDRSIPVNLSSRRCYGPYGASCRNQAKMAIPLFVPCKRRRLF